LGVAMADSAFRFLTANPAFLTMLGYSSEELQHLSFLDICDDEECDERRVSLRELRNGARPKTIPRGGNIPGETDLKARARSPTAERRTTA